jgi:hypothetical protein
MIHATPFPAATPIAETRGFRFFVKWYFGAGFPTFKALFAGSGRPFFVLFLFL